MDLVCLAVTGGHVLPEKVGILTLYSAQARHIESLLRPELRAVSVATVDGFKGQERDFVVVSFAQSNPRGDLGFLDHPTRVSVVLTRARRNMVCLGNVPTLLACTQSGLSRFVWWASDKR